MPRQTQAATHPADSRLHSLFPWIVWGLGALFYCYAFFQRVAPSVMVDELMRDFMVGATITGTLSSLYFYTYAGLQVPVGLMVDRWGARRMLCTAGVLSAFGSFAFASADSLVPAYVGRSLIGAGAAVALVATLKLASAWFPPNRFAFLTGLTLAIGMAGAVGGQVPLAAAVEVFGWRGTMIGAAVGAGVLTVATWLIVRDRPRDDGEVAAAADKGAAPAQHGFLDGLKAALREPQTYWVALFGAMLAGPMLAFPGLWGVPYMMRAYDLTRPEAAVMTSIMLVGWGIGSPFFGWLTDRIGRRKLPMLMTSSASLVITLIWLYGGLPLGVTIPLLFLTGLFAGGMTLLFATAREHNPPWAAGATLGLVNTCVMATGAIFQPLIGWLLDVGWDGTLQDGVRVYSIDAYHIALAVLPACHLLSLLGAVMVRETWCVQVKKS